MKRPFLYGAISMLVALLACLQGYMVMPLLIVVILVVYHKTHLIKEKTQSILMVLLFGLFSMVYFMYIAYTYDQVKAWLIEEELVVGTGVIRSVDQGAYGVTYGLKPWWDSDGKVHKFELRIRGSDGGSIGDYVSFEGEVLDSHGGYNEGAFNTAAYYRSIGVVALVEGYIHVDHHNHRYALAKYLSELRQDHSNHLHQSLPERNASILDDLLLGLKAVDDEDKALFQGSGIIHILAISGLHVSLIAGLLFKLMGLIHYKQKHNAVCVLLLTTIYCIYTGGHVSTVRATIMIAVYLGHMIAYRKYDKHTAIAAAFVLMMFVNPLQITSAGFMLSFGAVLSIFYIVPRLKTYIPKEMIWLKPIVILLGIQIGLVPVLAYYYHELPSYGFLGNILILPIVTLVIVFGALTILVTYLSGQLALLIAGNVFWLTNYMLDTVELISHLPLSLIKLPQVPIIFIVTYYVMVLAWLMHRRSLALLSLSAILMGLTFLQLLPDDALLIDMMDVGNGDACFLRYHDYVVLIDGGGQVGYEGDNVGEKVLMPYLNYHGIRKIHTVIISHSDFDHIYGIIELMNQVSMDRIMVSSVYESYEDPMMSQLKAKAVQAGVELVFIDQGDGLQIDDLDLTCLYPLDDEVMKDNNRHSNVLHIQLEDFDMLFTGDVYIEDEALLMDHWPRHIGDIEVLKVPHHGSKTSSSQAFLEFLRPKISLISVGRNNLYGHPAEAVMTRVYEVSDKVYMTKNSGQISLKYDRGTIEVETYMK